MTTGICDPAGHAALVLGCHALLLYLVYLLVSENNLGNPGRVLCRLIEQVVHSGFRLACIKAAGWTCAYLNVICFCQALRKVPGVNSSWHGDFIRQYHNIDISVAVQTPSGLMVPVIRDTDSKGLTDIGASVKALAGKVGHVTLARL